MNALENLLFVERQDGKREIRIVGKVNHIPEEGYILTNEAMGGHRRFDHGHDQ